MRGRWPQGRNVHEHNEVSTVGPASARSSRFRGARWVGALMLWAVVAGISGAPADAATYSVESCTDANPGIAGWAPMTTGAYVYAVNNCPKNGYMDVAFLPDAPHARGDRADYYFDAPAGTSIGHFAAVRTSDAGPDRAYGNPHAILVADGVTIDECTRAYGCNTRPAQILEKDFDGGVRRLAISAVCTGSAGCPAGLTSYRIRQVRVDLNDTTDPTFTSPPAGPLTSAQNTDRKRSLTYAASDAGGGVYRQLLLVDGKAVVDQPVNDNGGKCKVPFRDPVPCRTTPTNGSVELDTSGLSDGEHTVQLVVRDATDKNQVQTPPWKITVKNAVTPSASPGAGSAPAAPATVTSVPNPATQPGPNGTPSTAEALVTAKFLIGTGKHVRSAKRTVAPYGRHLRVRGTLQTTANQPIGGARVYLVRKTLHASSKAWRLAGSAVTGGDGRYTIPVTATGRNRDLRVVYFPQAGSDVNRASDQLTMRVRQDASFTVSHHRLRNGSRVRFSGRVHGTIASPGAYVRVQVRLRGSWFTFTKLKTSRSKGGRFRAYHRFTKTRRSTRYRFRVLVLPRNRTANTQGFSRHQDVRVVP